MDSNDMCIHLSRSYVRHLGHLVYKQNKKLLQIISKQEFFKRTTQNRIFIISIFIKKKNIIPILTRMDFMNISILAVLFITVVAILVFLIMDNDNVANYSNLNGIFVDLWNTLTSEETTEESS